MKEFGQIEYGSNLKKIQFRLRIGLTERMKHVLVGVVIILGSGICDLVCGVSDSTEESVCVDFVEWSALIVHW